MDGVDEVEGGARREALRDDEDEEIEDEENEDRDDESDESDEDDDSRSGVATSLPRLGCAPKQKHPRTGPCELRFSDVDAIRGTVDLREFLRGPLIHWLKQAGVTREEAKRILDESLVLQPGTDQPLLDTRKYETRRRQGLSTCAHFVAHAGTRADAWLLTPDAELALDNTRSPVYYPVLEYSRCAILRVVLSWMQCIFPLYSA